MSVKVSSKYQVVIPDQVRQALGLRPGTVVDVIAKGGIAYIVPVKTVEQMSERLKEMLDDEDVKTVREKKDRKV